MVKPTIAQNAIDPNDSILKNASEMYNFFTRTRVRLTFLHALGKTKREEHFLHTNKMRKNNEKK